MPIYEYKCPHCLTKFEAIRPMREADFLIPCKSCHSEETRRVISICFTRSDGHSKTSQSTRCGGCSGKSCSSCNH